MYGVGDKKRRILLNKQVPEREYIITDDEVIEFKSQEKQKSLTDALSELVRQGARQIIAQAVEAELSEFLSSYGDLKDQTGRQGVVRN